MKPDSIMLAAVLLAGAMGAAAQDLGRVSFRTSCTPAAQEKFDRGVALVHSFYFPETTKAFAEVLQADPDCAIAYWGIAISQRTNPLVLPLPASALKAGLEAVQKGKAIGAKTEREHDWLAAIEVYYKDYDRIDQTTRGLAYESAMERLMLKYPEDVEAAIFYALSLNETAVPSDKTYSKLIKAGAMLEKIADRLPEHPGVLHYIIHSYDYPPLARRAINAANRYAKVAPGAPHARHMPAHIYSMVGMWPESIASNASALAAAREQAAKTWPGAAHPVESHMLDFTEYALLQIGQEKRAKQIVDENDAIRKLGFDYVVGYTGLAAVPARYALERQSWREAATLEPRDSAFPQAEAITHFARAMGSARGGDLVAAEREVTRLKELRTMLERAHQPYWAEQVEIQALAASAWIAQAMGRKDEALKFMRAAADVEDGSEKHVAMENRLYPMRELLGDLLMAQQRPAEALKEYETAMASTPNRLRGLYGAAKAADLALDPQKAATYFRSLVELTRNADTDRTEIREARAFLARR